MSQSIFHQARWFGGRASAVLLCIALSSCGGGGSGSDQPTPPKPTVTITADPGSVFTGGVATLTWSSTHAVSCAASGGWTGTRNTSGSASTAALTTATTFTLTCTGEGGSTSGSTTVSIAAVPAPAAPQGIQAAVGDGSITVSWQSLAGSFYQGDLVTTNVYVSTHAHIDPATFVENADNHVLRGLAVMAPVVFTGLTNGTPVYLVATDVANGIGSLPSAEIHVTPTPIPALVEHIAALDDTGVDGCTDFLSLDQPCPAAAAPNQDAEVGRDAAARGGLLAKTGSGHAGFDFTKLDANGAPLPNDASTWPCVQDNTTGLTWEVPGHSAMTDAADTYSWYEPDERLHGGNPGVPAGGTCSLTTSCDTHAFVAALNAAAFCGFTDWRLPTRRELLSIVDLSRTGPAFDPSAFPHMSSWFNAYYWSSTVDAATSSVGFSAFAVDVVTGQLISYPKGQVDPFLIPGAAMAVRSNATP